jgi:Flp pilus assembly protein TadG
MRGFWSNRDGNIALTFALLLFPLVGFVGVALDYSMATAYRTDLQKALDATALALTKIMPTDQATLDTVGNQYFQANLGPHTLTNLQLTVTPDVGTLKVSVKGTYNVQLAHVIGATSVDIGASAEAKWSIGKVEIALVLDNSLSMNEAGKIQALRTATVNLLNVLEAAARNPGDAKVGIVSFDGMVNTGYTHATAPGWIRWDWWDANVGSCSKSFNTADVPEGTWLKAFCEGQFACTKSQYSTKRRCEDNGGSWVLANARWTSQSRNNWNGCVYDRDQAYDVDDTSPSGNSTYYPAAKCFATPPQAMTALSENWEQLKTKANNLTPTGYTNIGIGLAWGWHVLSKTGVFTEGAEYNTDNLNKYVILMTDGYNTKNISKEPQSCPTNGPACPSIDPRTAAVCTKIKDAGIEIYTVRLVNGNETLLRDCASNPTMYYDVANASELSGVFSAIGSQIANLHLSK